LTYCTNCGQRVLDGQPFCTNCGYSTAPTSPSPQSETARPERIDTGEPQDGPPHTAVPTPQPEVPSTGDSAPRAHPPLHQAHTEIAGQAKASSRWGHRLLVTGIILLVAIAGFGGAYLSERGHLSTTVIPFLPHAPAPTTTVARVPKPTDVTPQASRPVTEPSSEAPSVPSVQPTGGAALNIASQCVVAAPAAAPAGKDSAGNPVHYVAENMLDGIPETAWVTHGDASGKTMTFTLPRTTHVTRVGLVNGYAKTDPYDGTNRYKQERRIVSATWSFDNGDPIAQTFSERRAMQSIAVPDATTRIVRLRIDVVTGPNPDPAQAVDATAISDVLIQTR
jgi:hypothetical protein